MIIDAATADILLAIGSFIGVVTKAYALKDKQTVWSRKSSGFNVATYPITALLPFYILELYYTFFVSMLNFLIWTGIFLFRNPEKLESD